MIKVCNYALLVFLCMYAAQYFMLSAEEIGRSEKQKKKERQKQIYFRVKGRHCHSPRSHKRKSVHLWFKDKETLKEGGNIWIFENKRIRKKKLLKEKK